MISPCAVVLGMAAASIRRARRGKRMIKVIGVTRGIGRGADGGMIVTIMVEKLGRCDGVMEF